MRLQRSDRNAKISKVFDPEKYVFSVKRVLRVIFSHFIGIPLQKDGNGGGAIAPEPFPSFGRDVPTA